MIDKKHHTFDHNEVASVRVHVNLNAHSRENKAKKIEKLAYYYGKAEFRNMLDVGAGSGFIASYFSQRIKTVHAVDIVDVRQITRGFQFQLAQGTALPFANKTFDFVISNHVVEHVGSSEVQVHHLKEIFRCLEPGGILYFAVPNRWRLIEPHYKLPFLSWFPNKLSSAYLRLFKRSEHYDCKPLSQLEAVHLLRHSGFECNDVTLAAISMVVELEGGRLSRFATLLPESFWRLFSTIIPTFIFVCRKPLD